MRSDGQCTHVFTVHSTHVFTPGTQFQQLVYNYFLETVLSIKTFNIHLGAINSVSKSRLHEMPGYMPGYMALQSLK